MRIGGASTVEIVKRGVARYDLSDPYHVAIELSWKEFALAFLGLELGINIAFALLYLASPGCIANMRPGIVFRRILFQHRDASDRRLWNHGSGDVLWSRRLSN